MKPLPGGGTRALTRWEGCYRHAWGALLTPAAYAHPSKVSKALAFRLVKHLLEQGYVLPGQTVLDPFAGIGGFALPCLHYGLRYVGIELERRFVDLAQQNLALWSRRYGYTGGMVVPGDSRNLRRVLGEMCVSQEPDSASMWSLPDNVRENLRKPTPF